MASVKLFHTFDQQLALLASRGMDIGDHDLAIEHLSNVNYYRLSGYWYPFRRLVDGRRGDDFYPGTTLSDVIRLYHFDAALRTMAFASLATIELTVRAALGHALGDVGQCIHLEPDHLNARARAGEQYARWRRRYERELDESREDFVVHHREKYSGVLPVWAAVEVLDWGSLTRLYGFAPREVQEAVAAEFGLRGPQLESWMKSLNIVRNVCAHHGCLFNRVFALVPKLPQAGRYPELDRAAPFSRTFGQLTLIQFLLKQRSLKRSGLPAVLGTFPSMRLLPSRSIGAPDDWAASPLWH
ncbi:Abi family protein [Leifsonia sp. NPDC014704]|uniref:Abi family protein n=1 Tax=Leifsonia sp. NPDC014704 TaxID=3364123 RepID=UPI0036F45532